MKLLILYPKQQIYLHLAIRKIKGHSMLKLIIALCITLNLHANEKYQLSYKLSIPNPDFPFKSLKVWVPLPKKTHEQDFEILNIETPVNYYLGQDRKYNNQSLFFDLSNQKDFPIEITIITNIDRKIAKFSRLKYATPKSEWTTSKFTSSNRLIPNHQILSQRAQGSMDPHKNRFEHIKSLYLDVVSKMKYSKHGLGWGQGDALWACASQYGNCTDFHSVLIGMARSANIPARFEIGLPIPKSKIGPIKGYHCWARLYDQERGWIPVDASESYKTGVHLRYFGKLPADRIHFSTGRDIILDPAQEAEPLNYFIYPYIEIDGVPSDRYEKEFVLQ
ncbi:transglutaminase domain-containing protein [bacterium]|nr:transglutaminase domain-containing protein [bacterium]